MKRSLITAISLSALLTGCAIDPVAEYYQDLTKQMPVSIQQKLLPPTNAEPQVVQTTLGEQSKKDARNLMEQGYVMVGEVDFSGPAVTQSELVQQAKKSGADIVLFTVDFMGTQEGVRPLITYQPGQTSTTSEFGTVNANAYGSGGYASGFGTYSGTATTTSSGTFNTQYVPYQYNVYQSTAAFFRRMKPTLLGARLTPIPDNLRQSLQRNTGAYVDMVIQDSPAFRANILEGDIIIQIADKPVAMPQDLIGILPQYAGQKVPMKVLRSGKELDIDVQLNGNG
jgi:hypothetical protein